MANSHKILSITPLPNKISLHPCTLNVTELAQEQEFKEVGNGNSQYGNAWWSNPDCPYSFVYLSLDSLYRRDYFWLPIGHPIEASAEKIYGYMQEVYTAIFNRPFSSILELGSGGGEITKCFAKNNLDYVVVEGTTEGVERLISRGIDKFRIWKYNLKFMPLLKRKFDIVMCTEVAEHIEPFFASKVVDNCIQHSDVVWFSAANRERQPHYHHCNEQDIQVWDNLFAHMGFPYYVEIACPDDRGTRVYMKEHPNGFR